MKKNLIKSLILFIVVFLKVNAFSQIIKLVSPSNLNGWQTVNIFEDPMTLNTTLLPGDIKYIRMECGPTNPRKDLNLQNGSFYLNLTTADKTPNKILRRLRLNNTEHGGTLLKNLTRLLYSTNIANNSNNSAPVLTLIIDNGIDGKANLNINLEPQYQSTVLLAEWQEWKALDGKWWVFDPNKKNPETLKNGVPVDDPITKNPILGSAIKDHLFSWSDLLKKINKNVKIIAGSGIRFTIGGSSDFDNFKGYVDAFTIQKVGETEFTCYDFFRPLKISTRQTVCKGQAIKIGVSQIPGNTYSWTVTNRMPPYQEFPMTETDATITINPGENTKYTVSEKSISGTLECNYKTTIIVEVYEGICPGGTGPFNWWYRILFFIGGIGGIIAAWYIYRRVQRRRNAGK